MIKIKKYFFQIDKAFTLIELLIVIGIISIISVFGILNLFSFRSYQDLNLTVNGIAAVLRSAQSRSISQESGGNFGVHFENSSSGENFYDLFQGSNYISGNLILRTSLKREIQFINPASGSSKDIVFSPITGLPASSSTVIIAFKRDNSISKTITINSNGQIQF
ncbi:MAG: GspH/FimT family pseudopilin [Patescibacteria group bacterium]